jgi:hypothetical protein
VPTPYKATRIRETSIARILKSRRIRCVMAPEVLAVLRAAYLARLRGSCCTPTRAHYAAHTERAVNDYRRLPPARRVKWFERLRSPEKQNQSKG